MMGHWGFTLVTWLSVPMLVYSFQAAWRPIKSRPDFAIGPRITYRGQRRPIIDTCALHKVVMNQLAFHQYVQYKHHIPELKEFTLCAWHKLYNYSSDQPIFSYALPHKPRAILSWISNSIKKSYYMLAINGHTMYRLNYPMKLNKWYHMCQSWNGKTAEWQLWVNNERVGRGYYNLMAGKSIKSGGIAISGQEQIEYGGGFHLKGKRTGLTGEITLLQLYKAALTVGKAYTDHNFHHVHTFNNDGEDGESTPAPPEVPQDEGGRGINNLASEKDHPFFENGQLKHILPVNELLARPPVKSNILNNAQFSGDLENISPTTLFKFQKPIYGNIYAPHNFKYIKRDGNHVDYEIIRKKITRHERSVNLTDTSDSDWKPIFINKESKNIDQPRLRQYVENKIDEMADNRTQKKRALVLEEHIFSPLEFISDTGISNLHHFSDGHDIPSNDENIKYIGNTFDEPFSYIHANSIPNGNGKKKEFEPAEWEVQKISELCSGCGDDPFKKGNVLSWQETPKKLFAGALYVSALPKCHIF